MNVLARDLNEHGYADGTEDWRWRSHLAPLSQIFAYGFGNSGSLTPTRIYSWHFLDILSCFRFPRIFPDLVRAIGFMVGPIFYAANVGMFGSIASASSWEPFRIAIAALAAAYFFSLTSWPNTIGSFGNFAGLTRVPLSAARR